MLVFTMEKNPNLFLNRQGEFNSHFTLMTNGIFITFFLLEIFAVVSNMLLRSAKGFKLLTGLLHASLKKKKRGFRKQ